jgi:hypothetical protein
MHYTRLDRQLLLETQHRSISTHGRSTFFLMLREAAKQTAALQDQSPKIARYVASLQKSLLTQAVLALHFEGATGTLRPSLTAARLIDFAKKYDVASKNTVTSHLAELRAYRLITESPEEGDKRARPLIATQTTENLLRQWFDTQLACLDMLDNGSRYRRSVERRDIFTLAQPCIARRLATESEWSNPPASIGSFVRSEYGVGILQHLIARLPERILPDDRISLGSVLISDFPRKYTISLSHTQRLFFRARQDGWVGWDRQARANDFWISRQLVQQYEQWQFVKFLILDDAFHWASTLAAA